MNKLDFTSKRENQVKAYSELGKDLKIGQWGVSEYRGRLIKNYSDPELTKDIFTDEIVNLERQKGFGGDKKINIVDFGGGDGVLIKMISEQLKEAGFDNMTSINLDFTGERLKKMKNDYGAEDNLDAVLGDVIQAPIKDESIDFGVSRYCLQYLPEDKQKEAIKEMLRTIKPGGELIIQVPAAGETREQAELINELHNKVNAVIASSTFEEATESRYCPSLEDFKKIAEELGVEADVSFIEGLKFPTSAEAYIDRFQIKDEIRQEKIKGIYQDNSFKERAAEIGGIKFVEEDGIIQVESPDGKAIFKK